MARTITSLTIFLSSPSDLSLERNLISTAVDNVNRIIRNSHGVQFEIWKWEHDAIPGVASSSQAVIDQQVPEHDVYLGLMWKRFGSPTHSSGSGTEHEFKSSLEAHKQGMPPRDILFLFKTELGSLQDLDAEEYVKVGAFKRSLGDLGVLYSNFADTTELERMLHMQLIRIAAEHSTGDSLHKKLSAENPQTIVTTSNQTALIAQPDNEAEWELSDELGFLDYDEMCELGLAEGTAILTQLSAALGDMGASLGRRTNEINLANSQLDTRSTQGMRSILNNSAEDIVVLHDF